jgi:hypothetical protein
MNATPERAPIWNGFRICWAYKDQELDKVLAVGLLWKYLQQLQAEADSDAGQPEDPFLQPGRMAATAWGDNQLNGVPFSATVREAFGAAQSQADLVRIERNLESAFTEWRRTVERNQPAAAELAGRMLSGGGNPHRAQRRHGSALRAAAALAARADSVRQHKETEVLACCARIRQESERARQILGPLATPSSRRAGERNGGLRMVAVRSVVTGLLALFLLYWMFSLPLRQAGAGGAGAALAAGGVTVWHLRRRRTVTVPARTTRTGLVQELCPSLIHETIRYYENRAHVAIAEYEATFERGLNTELNAALSTCSVLLEAEALVDLQASAAGRWSGIPDRHFEQVDAGALRFCGRELVEALLLEIAPAGKVTTLASRVIEGFHRVHGRGFREAVLSEDAERVIELWEEAARQEVGEIPLHTVLKVMLADPVRRRCLAGGLQLLMEMAASVAMRRPDVNLDGARCRHWLRIGLPQGTHDPYQQFLEDLFPRVTFYHSWNPDAVEVVYEIRNLSLDELQLYTLNKPHYEQWEPAVRAAFWHYPLPGTPAAQLLSGSGVRLNDQTIGQRERVVNTDG